MKNTERCEGNRQISRRKQQRRCPPKGRTAAFAIRKFYTYPKRVMLSFFYLFDVLLCQLRSGVQHPKQIASSMQYYFISHPMCILGSKTPALSVQKEPTFNALVHISVWIPYCNENTIYREHRRNVMHFYSSGTIIEALWVRCLLGLAI